MQMRPESTSTEPHIGRLNESSLHACLKNLYAGSRGRTEQLQERWVCDVKQADGSIVEIQTGSFAPLYKKVKNLSLYSPVRIVHPVAQERWIRTHNPDGTLKRVRKSPKKGSRWELFEALIHAPLLPRIPNCTVDILMIDMAEIRMDDGKGSWRRRGIRLIDRELIEIRDCISLHSIEDWEQFIPLELRSDSFTSKDLAESSGISRALAGKVVYVMTKSGFLIEEKRVGRFKSYSYAAIQSPENDS